MPFGYFTAFGETGTMRITALVRFTLAPVIASSVATTVHCALTAIELGWCFCYDFCNLHVTIYLMVPRVGFEPAVLKVIKYFRMVGRAGHDPTTYEL